MYQVQADAELAQILHQEELDELERVQKERVVQEEASQTSINKELDDIQAMIEANEQILVLNWSIKEEVICLTRTEWSVQEQIGEEPKAIGEELSQEQLHQMMMIYSEDTRKYWKIIRVGGHIEAYQTFDDMLKKFDRDDLDKLWNLVKERFRTTEPTKDKARELWKKYPLTQEMLSRMLSRRLEVDHESEMAYELLSWDQHPPRPPTADARHTAIFTITAAPQPPLQPHLITTISTNRPPSTSPPQLMLTTDATTSTTAQPSPYPQLHSHHHYHDTAAVFTI
ncbi:hypothetical protein Tco_1284817 [Tanacetum coccineum]